MMIYPEMCGDYYSRTWTATEFEDQFDILVTEDSYIAATEAGFVRLNLIEKIGQVCKRLLGGTDFSKEQRIQAAGLKFLYYAEVHEFLTPEHISRLRTRLNKMDQPLDPNIKRFFNEISAFHQNQIARALHLKNLREQVTHYHNLHSSSLRPGVWSRLWTSPSLEVSQLVLFGNVHLKLFQNALNQETPDPYLAFAHLQKAFAVKNDSLLFQTKLANYLEHLEVLFMPEIKDQKNIMQEWWIDLAQTSFKNQYPDQAHLYLTRALQINSSDLSYSKTYLRIGQLYLMNQQYEQAKPFLLKLQNDATQDPLLLSEIGNAYWQEKKFEEALSAYKIALVSYQKKSNNSVSDKKQIAFIHDRMGTVHLNNGLSTNPDNLDNAIKCFALAVKTDSETTAYQEHVCQAYSQQWKASPKSFASTYGRSWLDSLDSLSSNVTKKYNSEIASILLDCSEQYFQSLQNSQAHVCLEKAFQLFPEQVDLKIKGLDLAIRQKDWESLEPDFDQWVQDNYANPYLREKLGEAYWDTDRNFALNIYKEALDLFNTDDTCCDEKERLIRQQHVADIQAKIAQNLLTTKSGVFTAGIPYAEVIERLEKAARLNPVSYTSILSATYLMAAQAEKQRTLLLRDTKKIISYYQKAFDTLPKNDPYLVELMQFYLDAKQSDRAVKLYYAIQKQPWAKEFVLPAEGFSQLATKFYDLKDYDASLHCLKQAYQQSPKNKEYKKNYFQFSLTILEDRYKKIQENNNQKNDENQIQHLITLVQMLTACWDEGFLNVLEFKPRFQEAIVKIYTTLAGYYVQRCLLPLTTSEYSVVIDKNTSINQHLAQHQTDSQQALQYYDEGLLYHAENAALRFDKGLLLEHMNQPEEALKCFEKAVEYQDRNYFYHKFLGMLHFVVYGDLQTKNKYEERAQDCALPNFTEDYTLWLNEYRCSVKTKKIDPHTYISLKSGWF